MKLPCEIEELIRTICAYRAYEVIKFLGNPNVSIFCNGILHNIKNVIDEETNKWMKAKDIGPFLFWGGPKNALKYYCGTLYTLLCDRIFDSIATFGTNVTICKVNQAYRAPIHAS